MRQFIADIHNRDEEGATAAEYVFLLVFVAIAATLGMSILGQGLVNEFNQTNTAVTTPDANGGTVPTAPGS